MFLIVQSLQINYKTLGHYFRSNHTYIPFLQSTAKTSGRGGGALQDAGQELNPPMLSKNFDILLAYSVELCVGRRLDRSVRPTWMTSLWTYTSPGRVVSTFPPVSAARSTITLPGRIDSTCSYQQNKITADHPCISDNRERQISRVWTQSCDTVQRTNTSHSSWICLQAVLLGIRLLGYKHLQTAALSVLLCINWTKTLTFREWNGSV